MQKSAVAQPRADLRKVGLSGLSGAASAKEGREVTDSPPAPRAGAAVHGAWLLRGLKVQR